MPASRKDVARKAFEKLAKPVLPASHGQLARAIEREARDYHGRQTELEQNARPEADPSADAVSVKSEEPRGRRSGGGRRRREPGPPARGGVGMAEGQ